MCDEVKLECRGFSLPTEQDSKDLNTPANIDKAVERYADYYYKIDEDFIGDTLDEYKEFMKESLSLFLAINIGADSQEVRKLSYPQKNTYILHIKEKYRKIFFDYIVESTC